MASRSSDDDRREGGDLIRGMESVIATVSGYHGTERFNLIKLIASTGASYVGTLAKSTTHLVCWEFKGEKYNLARRFGTKVVSHRWFEDCVKEGRRLPEDSYIMKCGREVGHLSWVHQFVDYSRKKDFGAKGKNKVALLDRSNRLDCFNIPEFSSFSTERGWSNSYLLNESQVSGLGSSRAITRHKRNTCSGSSSFQDSSLESGPASKHRRLVKKNACSDHFYNETVDLEEDCYLIESFNVGRIESINPECNNVNNRRRDGFSDSQSPLSDSRNGDTRQLEIFENQNKTEDLCSVGELTAPSSSIDPSACVGSHVIAPEAVFQDSCMLMDSELTKNKDSEKSDNLVMQDGLLTSELSCVICFAEYSLTRGVLPCGHRFCYSCIKDWADRVIAERKIPTCPLCKAKFAGITKLEDSAFSDQKIYSQTVPCSSFIVDIPVVHEIEDSHLERSFSSVTCLECRLHEPEDLLTSCHVCRNLWVHSCCLDPPLVPWTCIHCRDLRMLYQLYR